MFTSVIRVKSKQDKQHTQPDDAPDGYELKKVAIIFVKAVFFFFSLGLAGPWRPPTTFLKET